jgi:hypothetical protein
MTKPSNIVLTDEELELLSSLSDEELTALLDAADVPEVSESTERLVSAIISDDDVGARDAFDAAMADKGVDTLSDKKIEVARSVFGGDDEDETEGEPEAEDLELTDEEIEALASLSDEDLEELLSNLESDESEAPDAE